LFIDASFDKNTKTYIKFNREPRLQNTSVTDLAKEVFSLKKEVCELKEKSENRRRCRIQLQD
jgi:hypothetical protein